LTVALGIVRALQRLGVDAGFAKPVDQDITDNSEFFARTLFQMPVPEPLSLQETAERIAANQTSELMEEIVTPVHEAPAKAPACWSSKGCTPTRRIPSPRSSTSTSRAA
jgi:BioD-like phosphotransacetylase family protein